jgi:hypothetical protein
MVDALSQKQTPGLELLPEGRGFLLVEFGTNDAGETEQRAQQMIEALRRGSRAPSVRLYSKAETKAVWQIREAGPRAPAFQPGAPLIWEGWDDAAVAPEKLGAYLRELRKLLDEFSYTASFYGHFGHGCVHMQISFDLLSDPGIRKYREFIDRAADLVVSYDGSLSGEHGDGQARGVLLPKMFGPELMQAFRMFKTLWDPDGKMNPHKVVDAYSPAENLRLGAEYNPLQPNTHFKFPEDEGSFSRATLHCIGIGACRKSGTGTMCPSYMATLEEEHSTRGRLYHGSYPHVTSQDTSVAGCLSEAGISPSRVRKVVMVIRTYPIRVESPMKATSGPMDLEIDWQVISKRSHIPLKQLEQTERTTTTDRRRRVGEFDWHY